MSRFRLLFYLHALCSRTTSNGLNGERATTFSGISLTSSARSDDRFTLGSCRTQAFNEMLKVPA